MCALLPASLLLVPHNIIFNLQTAALMYRRDISYNNNYLNKSIYTISTWLTNGDGNKCKKGLCWVWVGTYVKLMNRLLIQAFTYEATVQSASDANAPTSTTARKFHFYHRHSEEARTLYLLICCKICATTPASSSVLAAASSCSASRAAATAAHWRTCAHVSDSRGDSSSGGHGLRLQLNILILTYMLKKTLL